MKLRTIDMVVWVGMVSLILFSGAKDVQIVSPWQKEIDAAETIIEDVKAEIKRQAEKRKEGHAENH